MSVWPEVTRVLQAGTYKKLKSQLADVLMAMHWARYFEGYSSATTPQTKGPKMKY
jgi:hypothetical protein